MKLILMLRNGPVNYVKRRADYNTPLSGRRFRYYNFIQRGNLMSILQQLAFRLWILRIRRL